MAMIQGENNYSTPSWREGGGNAHYERDPMVDLSYEREEAGEVGQR